MYFGHPISKPLLYSPARPVLLPFRSDRLRYGRELSLQIGAKLAELICVLFEFLGLFVELAGA